MTANRLPKITIITPSYNQVDYIEKTIKSVLSQDYPNLEYIIMDGGSTDGTLEILRKYKKRFLWFSQKDNGQTDAINKGIMRSSGEIFSYLNADDLLEKGALKKAAEYFQNNPEIYWLTGKCYIINEKNKIVYFFITRVKNFLQKYFKNSKMLAVLNFIPQPATFFKREVFENVGLFDEKLYYVMDYDYWLRARKKYQLGFIDHYLASFRMHPKSKTGKNIVSLFKESYEIVKRHEGKFFACLHKLHGYSASFFINFAVKYDSFRNS